MTESVRKESEEEEGNVRSGVLCKIPQVEGPGCKVVLNNGELGEKLVDDEEDCRYYRQG